MFISGFCLGVESLWRRVHRLQRANIGFSDTTTGDERRKAAIDTTSWYSVLYVPLHQIEERRIDRKKKNVDWYVLSALMFGGVDWWYHPRQVHHHISAFIFLFISKSTMTSWAFHHGSKLNDGKSNINNMQHGRNKEQRGPASNQQPTQPPKLLTIYIPPVPVCHTIENINQYTILDFM